MFFFLLSFTRKFVVSVRRSSFSSGCLGNAVLMNCGTPLVFNITMFYVKEKTICIALFIVFYCNIDFKQ